MFQFTTTLLSVLAEPRSTCSHWVPAEPERHRLGEVEPADAEGVGGHPAGVGVGLHVALGAAHVDAGGEVLGAGDGGFESETFAEGHDGHAVAAERAALSPIRERADLVIDTTGVRPAELRRRYEALSAAGEEPNSVAWVTEVLEQTKAVGIGQYITVHSNQYSADIIALSGNGRVLGNIELMSGATNAPGASVGKSATVHPCVAFWVMAGATS